METILTPGNIMFAIGIIGMIFGIYKYFRNPQIDIEKKQLLSEEDLKDKATILSQKEVENRAQLLAQQFQWEREANEKKFCDMASIIKESTALAQNHIHTIDTKVDGLKALVDQMGRDIVKLGTIIEERFPRK